MNPFSALQVSDDEEEFTATSNPQTKQPKKTHQQRKQAKEAKIKEAEQQPKPTSTNEELPEKAKEDPRKKRYHEIVPPKEVPATGHYLDRHSGTGRTDKPRKEGGGRGGIGNLSDEMNKEKYIKEGEEGAVETQSPQVEEKKQKGMTLDEYYKSKGIEIESVASKKEEVKKGEITAQWIQKEKLTVLQTKEDKKAADKEGTQKKGGRRQYNNKVGADDSLKSELFGFNTADFRQKQEAKEHRQYREHREYREQREEREHREPRQGRDKREQRGGEKREYREQKQGGERKERPHRGERKQGDEKKEGGQRKDERKEGNRGNRDNRGQRGGNRGDNHQNKPQQPPIVLNEDDFPTL